LPLWRVVDNEKSKFFSDGNSLKPAMTRSSLNPSWNKKRPSISDGLFLFVLNACRSIIKSARGTGIDNWVRDHERCFLCLVRIFDSPGKKINHPTRMEGEIIIKENNKEKAGNLFLGYGFKILFTPLKNFRDPLFHLVLRYVSKLSQGPD
jgi:hypothetical protein